MLPKAIRVCVQLIVVVCYVCLHNDIIYLQMKQGNELP